LILFFVFDLTTSLRLWLFNGAPATAFQGCM